MFEEIRKERRLSQKMPLATVLGHYGSGSSGFAAPIGQILLGAAAALSLAVLIGFLPLHLGTRRSADADPGTVPAPGR